MNEITHESVAAYLALMDRQDLTGYRPEEIAGELSPNNLRRSPSVHDAAHLACRRFAEMIGIETDAALADDERSYGR